MKNVLISRTPGADDVGSDSEVWVGVSDGTTNVYLGAFSVDVWHGVARGDTELVGFDEAYGR